MVEPTLLTRGKAEAVVLATTATQTFDLDVGGHDELTVQADLTGTADGDLTVTVTPYGADNATLSGVVIGAEKSTGPTHAGGRVTYYGRFDVSGVNRVRVTMRNNNAGNQTLTRGSWALA